MASSRADLANRHFDARILPSRDLQSARSTGRASCALVRHDPDMPDADVTITLTGDEALVLFDLLHESVSAPSHQSEQIALWNLSTALEAEL